MRFRTVAPHRSAVVLPDAGERAVAWQVGVLAGLADAGLDLRGARRVVGTGTSALAASRLATGCDPRADADALACGDALAPPRDRAWPQGLRLALAHDASPTNAHLAAAVGVELVVLVDPVGAAPERRTPDVAVAAALHGDVAALEATGRTVAAIRAGAPDRLAMGPERSSGASAHLAVAAGRAAGRRWAERFAAPRLGPALTAMPATTG